MKRPLAGALAGALLGMSVPLAPVTHEQLAPTEWTPGAPETNLRAPSPLHNGENEARPRDLCVDQKILLDAQASALDAEHTLAAEAASFAMDWGTPIEPPPGWNAEEAAQALERRLEPLGVEFADVNCEHFPCLVLLASMQEPDVGALAGHFGVDEARLSPTTAGYGSKTVYIDTIPMIDGDLSEGERLWIRRLTHRQIVRTAADVSRLSQALEAASANGDPVPGD